MLNKVIHTLSRSMNDMGIPAVRFNFRGVGASDGFAQHTLRSFLLPQLQAVAHDERPGSRAYERIHMADTWERSQLGLLFEARRVQRPGSARPAASAPRGQHRARPLSACGAKRHTHTLTTAGGRL